MSRSEAQRAMCLYFNNGGVGVLISGLVWVIAAIILSLASFLAGIISFFVGGMMIYPLSALYEKRSNGDLVSPDKHLMKKAMLSLPILFVGLLVAYVLSEPYPDMFFPIMSITIGLRYLTFKSIYGIKAYLTLGGVLIVIGAVAITIGNTPPVLSALVTGFVEIFWGLNLIKRKIDTPV